MIILYLWLLLLYSRGGYGMGRNRGPRRRRAGILPFGYAVLLLSEDRAGASCYCSFGYCSFEARHPGTRYSQRGKARECAEFAGP